MSTVPTVAAPIAPRLSRRSLKPPLARRSARDRRRWLALRSIPFALVLLVAVCSHWLQRYSPTLVVGRSGQGPSAAHWFGTDANGMDVYARTVAATQVDLRIGVVATLLSTVAGVALGLVIGMNESRLGPVGALARMLARFVDLMQAIPALLVALALVALFGATEASLIVVIGAILAPIQVRLTRTEVLRVRSEAFLDSARMSGVREVHVVSRHVLPNSCLPALENATVLFGFAVIVVGSLGFLGIGLPPPHPEWGSMIQTGASDASVGRWWSAGFPTLALALAVAAFVILSGSLLRLRRR